MAVKVLQAHEQIQRTPAMWIDIATPEGIIREVVENAADELLNKYGKKILVDIKPKNDSIKVIVVDDGRGIPLTKVKLPNGEEIDSIIAICCHLFSGEKFDKETYEHSVGLHGVGLVVVNALSRYLVVKVSSKRRRKTFCYRFEKGLFIRQWEEPFDQRFSTYVEFEPDPQYFLSTPQDPHQYTRIHDLLKLLAIHEYTVYFCGNKIEYTLNQFLEEKLGTSDVAEFKAKTQKYALTYYISIRENPDSTCIGYINFHRCDGDHIRGFKTALTNVLSEITGLSKHIFNERVSFVGFVWAKEPKFESQSKTRFIEPRFSSYIDKKKLKQTVQNKFSDILQSIVDQYTLGKISRQTKRISADNPLKDCLKPQDGILYILEGESASSGLVQIRNKMYEAIMMLGGKIPNVWKDDILSNLKSGKVKNEVKWILEAIGWNDRAPKWRYKYIKILTDPDPDGQHIATLVILLLYEFAKDLIQQGRVKVVLTPIYLAVTGKDKYVPIYQQKEKSKYKQLIRIKGLAQIPPKVLRRILDDPLEFTISIPQDVNKLKMILLSNMKTELLERETLGFIQLLEQVAGGRNQ